MQVTAGEQQLGSTLNGKPIVLGWVITLYPTASALLLFLSLIHLK